MPCVFYYSQSFNNLSGLIKEATICAYFALCIHTDGQQCYWPPLACSICSFHVHSTQINHPFTPQRTIDSVYNPYITACKLLLFATDRAAGFAKLDVDRVLVMIEYEKIRLIVLCTKRCFHSYWYLVNERVNANGRAYLRQPILQERSFRLVATYQAWPAPNLFTVRTGMPLSKSSPYTALTSAPSEWIKSQRMPHSYSDFNPEAGSETTIRLRCLGSKAVNFLRPYAKQFPKFADSLIQKLALSASCDWSKIHFLRPYAKQFPKFGRIPACFNKIILVDDATEEGCDKWWPPCTYFSSLSAIPAFTIYITGAMTRSYLLKSASTPTTSTETAKLTFLTRPPVLPIKQQCDFRLNVSIEKRIVKLAKFLPERGTFIVSAPPLLGNSIAWWHQAFKRVVRLPILLARRLLHQHERLSLLQTTHQVVHHPRVTVRRIEPWVIVCWRCSSACRCPAYPRTNRHHPRVTVSVSNRGNFPCYDIHMLCPFMVDQFFKGAHQIRRDRNGRRMLFDCFVFQLVTFEQTVGMEAHIVEGDSLEIRLRPPGRTCPLLAQSARQNYVFPTMERVPPQSGIPRSIHFIKGTVTRLRPFSESGFTIIAVTIACPAILVVNMPNKQIRMILITCIAGTWVRTHEYTLLTLLRTGADRERPPSPTAKIEPRPAHWLEQIRQPRNWSVGNGDPARHRETQLNERFRDLFGQTAYAYLIQLRLRKAKEWLPSRPDWTVRRIGEAVGFRDASHFVATFRQKEGMTPETYRKLYVRLGEKRWLNSILIVSYRFCQGYWWAGAVVDCNSCLLLPPWVGKSEACYVRQKSSLAPQIPVPLKSLLKTTRISAFVHHPVMLFPPLISLKEPQDSSDAFTECKMFIFVHECYHRLQDREIAQDHDSQNLKQQGLDLLHEWFYLLLYLFQWPIGLCCIELAHYSVEFPQGLTLLNWVHFATLIFDRGVLIMHRPHWCSD
uniref:Beta-galactosidase n=1 Tax=Bacillus sp. TA-11 TaxID=83890 RepID=Q9ZH27_9BACI|nr:beta-galactosidase [Bacillus sp. TA-11]